MEQNALKEMDKLPVSKAVLKNILPTIGILLLTLIYNYADLFFIGMTGNDYAVSAVTLAFPVFMIFLALGSLYGTGALTMISQAAGAGDEGKNRNISSFCFWCCVITGFVLLAVIASFAVPLAKLLGAGGEETVGFTADYLKIVSISAPFAVVSSAFANLVRSEGKPGAAMIGLALGNILNIVLDPVFILGFGMGCAGAALATTLSQVIGAAFYVIYIVSGRSSLSIRPRDFCARGGIAKRVFAIGIPAALTPLMMSIYQMIQNVVIANFGDLAVGAMGVGMKLTMIVAAVTIAVGQGIQPLIGYQVGNQNQKRFTQIIRFSTVISVCAGLVLSAICIAAAKPIVGIFLSSEEAICMGISFSRIVLTTVWLLGMVNLLGYAIQAMGLEKHALIISLSRNGYVGIITVMLMGLTGSMYAVAWSQPMADVISLIITLFVFKGGVKKCFPGSESK